MVSVYDSAEDKIQVTDSRPFVTTNDVAPGDAHTPYAVIECPDNHSMGFHSGTPVAPTLLNVNGNPVDGSSRIIFQKRDPQGNPIGEKVIFDDTFDVFNLEKMRSDEDYFRRLSDDLLLDEREQLAIFVEVPSSAANGVDKANSRFTVGDNVTSTGKAVNIVDKRDMAPEERAAVEQANNK